VIVRRLAPGQEPTVRAFLAQHAASSMFLLSALHRSGLALGEDRTSGVWMGAFERGELKGVVAHLRLGNVALQAPGCLPLLLEYLAEEPRDFPVLGFVGPRAQVVVARQHPRSPQINPKVDTGEVLYELDLDQLIVPEPLARGRLKCVFPVEADTELLVRWGVAYNAETLGADRGPRVERSWRARVRDAAEEQRLFLLLRDDEPVAMSGFNATVPEAVQIGGVFTPPALRRRGFARACVAGSLVFARQQGVRQAVLFTEPDNPARRAYEAIGFREVGRYGILLYELP
jgi:ribosomal protein S18 acetylase RimI-like enzyme